jgi:hypothetical protein
MEGQLLEVEKPPRECCQDITNRSEPEQVSDDLSVTTCVCGARHFVLTVDPLEGFAEGASV